MTWELSVPKSGRELGGKMEDWSQGQEVGGTWLKLVFLKDKLEDVCGTKGGLMWEMLSQAALGPHPDPSLLLFS